jgi:hypothetical protein
VTTGSVGTAPASPLAYGPDALLRYWSGTDGKFELVNGFNRVKWNSFSCDVIGNSVKYPYVKIKYTWLGGGPPFEETVENAVGWNNGTFNFDEPQYIYPPYRPMSECLSDILSQVKGHDFNLGVELGQGAQTLGLLTENLKRLGRAALSLKRGDFAGAARCLGTSPRKGSKLKPSDISGRWLELQYGWLPLISSSYEAMQAFAEIQNGPRKFLFRASRRRKATWELSTAPSTATLRTKGYVRTAIQYEMYEEMSFTRQLGLEDPLSIAWELTPWSFVIDWFLPFGSYLSNLNQIPKLKGRWLITDSLKVEKGKVEVSYLAINRGPPNWKQEVLQLPEFRYWFSKTRRVYQESPPEVPFPEFKFGLNSSRRFFNALALAHQRFK